MPLYESDELFAEQVVHVERGIPTPAPLKKWPKETMCDRCHQRTGEQGLECECCGKWFHEECLKKS